jgi:hypothetical protein
METWRCGHERTKSNTAGVRPSKPGGQCRTCVNARERARQRERYADPEYRARKLAGQRAHYANDAEWRARKLARQQAQQRERYANDAEYREHEAARHAAWYRRTAGTPAGVERSMRSTHKRRAAQIDAHEALRARERPSRSKPV